MKRNCLHFAGTLLLLLVCSGCSPHRGPQVQLSALASRQNVCRLAVLPFTSEAGENSAAVQAYRIFSGELIATGTYQLEPEGEVHFFLNRKRLRLGELLGSQLYAELARQLEVDAVVRGRVITLEDKKGPNGSVPRCALQIDLLSAGNGTLLASSYHSRSGDEFQKVLHFGTIRTTSELLAQVSREIITTWQEKGLSHCSEK